MPLPSSEISRVLCIGAHPDDLDFGAAGTVAGFVQAGLDVHYLVCTRGEQGGFDDTDRDEMPRIREGEQRVAAAALGVADVVFLDGFRDGWLEPDHTLQREIVRAIRRVRPDRVVAQSPDRYWDRLFVSHPDHLAAGEAVVRAVYPAARNAFAYPELLHDEGLEPWTVRELWLMAHPSPDHYVDITDTFELKVAALREHVSQTGHMDELETLLRGWGTMMATAAGWPEGRLAEAFRVVVTA